MRTVSGKAQVRRRRRRYRGRVVACSFMRHHAEVTSTTGYNQAARDRLKEAVVAARIAAGFNSRTELANAAGLSLRSVDKLEQGKPGVGRRTLQRVADVLPGWTSDTPRDILDGGDPPGREVTPADTGIPPIPVAQMTDSQARALLHMIDRYGTDEWVEAAVRLIPPRLLPAVLRAGMDTRQHLDILRAQLQNTVPESTQPVGSGENSHGHVTDS